MPPTSRLLAPAGWPLLAACLACTSPSPPAAHDRRSIVGGTDDDGDLAVCQVALLDARYGCSGALVAPKVVLTAGHCGRLLVPGESMVFFGVKPGGVGRVWHTRYIRVHPRFQALGQLDHDMALVLLEDDGGVTPVTLPSATGTVKVGDTVRLVGFGVTNISDPVEMQRKREGTAIVTEVDDSSFRIEPGPALSCGGDSGGPAFLTVGESEVLAGTVSEGDVQCASFARLMRVDVAVAEFIEPFIADTAPGAAGPGDRCYYAEHCATGECLAPPDVPTFRYCSPACAGAGDCPEGMECAAAASGKACRWPAPSPGAYGARCDFNYDCESLECRRPYDEDGARCTTSCVEPDVPCPEGYECVPTDVPLVDACFPKRDGCDCRVGGGRPRAGAGGAVLALVLAALARRRRGRRSDGA